MEHSNSDIFLVCKDFLVTKKEFKLIRDKTSDMLYTFPQPKEEELSIYYDSEEYISHTDASTSWFDKTYQIVKQFSLNQKKKLLNRLVKDAEKKVLDFGCGTGDFLKSMKDEGWIVQGVEPNLKAKKLAELKGLDVYQNEKELTIKEYDIITLWHVLEHLPDLNHKIEFFSSKLKKDGYLIIAVPNYKSYDAKYYKSFWAAYDVPRHLWHFSKKSIKTIFQKNSFQLEKVKPMWFDAFYVSLLSEKYKKSSFGLFKAFIIGCISNLSGIFKNEYSSQIYILKKR